jgi:hypothetical protein
MKAPSVAVLFALVLMAGPCESQTEIVRRESFEFAGRTRTFHLFAPISAPDSAAAPLIVVLHGSYRRGRDAVTPWVDLARRENFVVAGPDAHDKTAWRMRADGPHSCARSSMQSRTGRRSIGVASIFLGILPARCTHSRCRCSSPRTSRLRPCMRAPGAPARNTLLHGMQRGKFLSRFFFGDRDEFFPMLAARKTEEALRAVQLVVLPGGNHDYRKADGGDVPRVELHEGNETGRCRPSDCRHSRIKAASSNQDVNPPRGVIV